MVNLSSFSQVKDITLSSSTNFKYKCKLSNLTGDVLDLIAEYLIPTQNLPKFIQCNTVILRCYSEYKKENFALQNEMLIEQIGELKRELIEYFDQKLFKMSKGLHIIYSSNINSKEWHILADLCGTK